MSHDTTREARRMRCPADVLGWIPWYADGGLTERERGAVEAHAAECADCRAELDIVAGRAWSVDGIELPDAECPKPAPRIDLPAGLAPVIDLLRVLLKTKCEEHDVAQKLVANAEDLSLIAADDKTVARVRVSATHKGEFMGVGATGKHVAMQLIDIMRFDEDGLVCEHWGVADMLSLMQQLGAVPE